MSDSAPTDVLAGMRRAIAILNATPPLSALVAGEPSKLLLLSAADTRPAPNLTAHLHGIPLPATVDTDGVVHRIEVSPLVPAGQAYVFGLDAIRDSEEAAERLGSGFDAAVGRWRR